MQKFNKTLEAVKAAGQDFEWYPTTQEIIKALHRDLYRYTGEVRLMDVGAGDGNLFTVLDDLNCTTREDSNYRYYTKYAIEKSQVLINNMEPDIFIIGTDFHHQTFIDKRMDVIFCNPPYSEYRQWMLKLIKECNCKDLYLVVLDRWRSDEIDSTIEMRYGTAKVLGNYSFHNSEYRQARANVQLVRITFKTLSYFNNEPWSDPFKIWFDETYKINAEKARISDYDREKEKQERITALTDKSKLVDNLVKYYMEDMAKLDANYRSLESLDIDLLKELSVNLADLKEGLRVKISGLKNLYWKELFDNMESITSRLTSKSRKSMLDTLTAHTSVDFTPKNIYSVVIWAIKNANRYIDSQLVDLYSTLTEKKNIIGYKSNQNMIDDSWRYASRWDVRKKAHHYTLDYRCVLEGWYGINNGYESTNNLNNSGHELIGDIFTIAKNLGFDVLGDSRAREWIPGKKQYFYTRDNVLIAEIKAYLNGNLHYKLNQDFMKKFNVEAGRLNGWIKSPKEAADEMGISEAEVKSYYNSNLQLIRSKIKLLEA